MNKELKPCPFCGKEMDCSFTTPGMALCSNPDCWFYSVYIPITTLTTRPIEDDLRAQLARRDDQIETLEDKLHKIADWCKAYPLEFADEPTSQEWEAAHKAMSENGFSLTCFVISGMRKVTTGIAEIANLREGEK